MFNFPPYQKPNRTMFTEVVKFDSSRTDIAVQLLSALLSNSTVFSSHSNDVTAKKFARFSFELADYVLKIEDEYNKKDAERADNNDEKEPFKS